jgi:hypothetical protein
VGEYALKILVVGFLAWVIWFFLRPRYVFEIRIRDGKPGVRRGKVTGAFLHRIAEACQASGVTHGWIGGELQGQRTALRFSRQIPPRLQQRLRNEWLASG